MSSKNRGNRAVRAAERKRLRNRLVRRSLKTHIIKARSAGGAGEESVHDQTMTAVSSLDKAVSKGIIHKNKGARLKSSLMKNLDKEQKATS
ncbi:MAG: 30S ribosomal protein S20 [Dehalococcoidia bacterium]